MVTPVAAWPASGSQEAMIHHALEAGKTYRTEIMCPQQVFSLSADHAPEEAMRESGGTQHSRVPVYDPAKGKENI